MGNPYPTREELLQQLTNANYAIDNLVVNSKRLFATNILFLAGFITSTIILLIQIGGK